MKYCMILFISLLHLACAATDFIDGADGTSGSDVNGMNSDPGARPLPPATNKKAMAPPVQVAFIGGSITRGTGASDYLHAWAGLTSDWLNEYFWEGAEAKNIAISGTTSQYATFRLRRDLEGMVPDIAFIEFSMNDPVDEDFVFTWVDALIYRLRQINPDMVIIYVATTRESNQEDWARSQEPLSLVYARDIATFNHIETIDIGRPFWTVMFKNDLNPQRFLPDGLHPSDDGHRMYFEIVQNELKKILPVASGTGERSSYYNGSGYSDATVASADKITSTSCIHQDSSLICDKYQWFEMDFTGIAIGFAIKFTADGGQIECILDDATTARLNFWDRYAIDFDHVEGALLFETLSDDAHHISCTVNDTVLSNPQGQSTGHRATIEGILLAKPQ
ncbi:MAG: SGNH/GDSL hydrolase family protein [Deltaproteobacteria bacterium]|nr:SGNH/GDSL hydrolase family protein [Deltaproteobacteria bacterium]